MSDEQPDKIWLIDMGDEIVWCDCPDPSTDVDERDVTGPYILENQND